MILDHFIETDGAFPKQKEMKHQFGHKLELLYERSKEVTERRSIQLQMTRDLSDPVHTAIMRVLHDFADGDRYSNIDILVGGRSSADPVGRWFEEVDTPLYSSRVSQKRKDQIAHSASLGARLLGATSMVRHTAETGDGITTFEEGSQRTGMWEAVAPYRQLAVLQIIRYWTELIIELGDAAHAVPGDGVPYFSEIFGMFCNEDSYLRSRKTWETL
ncbi:hypothetical protein CY658_08015 [Variovorax sp. RO1]|uniref:hypothetical protein n=1 Tax=Variovorax sp. RO1 TaxID=2066034 RepID=UPI000CA83C9B|nr:hypothetical protein [Variovorax sp. RO1]PLC06929.1 hypothetical protein CY658_08015 [Variovorax sp. RO1]